MSKHTPGPWDACGNLVRTKRNADGTGGYLVAECPANIGSRIEDARLIAAAPDLLEALRDMVSDHKDLSTATLRFARAAIAKAEGSA